MMALRILQLNKFLLDAVLCPKVSLVWMICACGVQSLCVFGSQVLQVLLDLQGSGYGIFSGK